MKHNTNKKMFIKLINIVPTVFVAFMFFSIFAHILYAAAPKEPYTFKDATNKQIVDANGVVYELLGQVCIPKPANKSAILNTEGNAVIPYKSCGTSSKNIWVSVSPGNDQWAIAENNIAKADYNIYSVKKGTLNDVTLSNLATISSANPGASSSTNTPSAPATPPAATPANTGGSPDTIESKASFQAKLDEWKKCMIAPGGSSKTCGTEPTITTVDSTPAVAGVGETSPGYDQTKSGRSAICTGTLKPDPSKPETTDNSVGPNADCIKGIPIMEYLQRTIDVLVILIIGGGALMIVVGGIQYTTARDNPQAVQAAKKRITDVVLGVVFFVFLYAFLTWLIPGGAFL